MADKATFQVIVLGPTGGPREDSVTGLLVRSTATQWSSNSMVAVDAGTLLAGIIRTLEQYEMETKDGKRYMKDGPFVGFNLPYNSPQANAAHIFREIIGTILVTHAHLDHLSGLAINTPIIEAGAGPKAVAALPSVVAAIKNHMFNDVIWPNLSDEDGGAGLLTYQRLVEGGNSRFGRGDARGYVRAADGLLTRCLSVSHGRCKKRYNPESESHHRVGSAVFAADPLMMPSRGISVDHTDGFYSPARSPRLFGKDPTWATVESSAFFIRDQFTGSEIIVFGDIEPDSISMDPRNRRVWEVAAPKMATGNLRAIFIECSYDDSVEDCALYGHLCPRHLVAELKVLATKVTEIRHPSTSTKRKRTASSPGGVSPRSKRAQSLAPGKAQNRRSEPYPYFSGRQTRVSSGERGEMPDLVPIPGSNGQPASPNFNASSLDGVDGNPTSEPMQVQFSIDNNPPDDEDLPWAGLNPPLAGLSVYIIHIKEDLADGPPPGDRILQELRDRGEAAQLGCEFHITKRGEGIWI
ncbi:hypothetical protein SI65_05341 [Aspergillus cristatus]|uniref:3',5'-cyclic-nucleotide phosphodiesterase n=1 Tax=Aspergillus cristatus TaxID=573508 RepID=A0A1E3BCQ6_ASPCR|nr:hypothetical protein SI65_05341 [Aspergillus cristatus]